MKMLHSLSFVSARGIHLRIRQDYSVYTAISFLSILASLNARTSHCFLQEHQHHCNDHFIIQIMSGINNETPPNALKPWQVRALAKGRTPLPESPGCRPWLETSSTQDMSGSGQQALVTTESFSASIPSTPGAALSVSEAETVGTQSLMPIHPSLTESPYAEQQPGLQVLESRRNEATHRAEERGEVMERYQRKLLFRFTRPSHKHPDMLFLRTISPGDLLKRSSRHITSEEQLLKKKCTQWPKKRKIRRWHKTFVFLGSRKT